MVRNFASIYRATQNIFFFLEGNKTRKSLERLQSYALWSTLCTFLSDFSPSEKGGFVFCFQLSEMRHIYDFMIEKDQPLEKDHPLGFCVVDFFTIPLQTKQKKGCSSFTSKVHRKRRFLCFCLDWTSSFQKNWWYKEQCEKFWTPRWKF